MHRVWLQRLQPLHCIHSRFSPTGVVSGVQLMQVSVIWGPTLTPPPFSYAGLLALLVVDFGVGIAEPRSLGAIW